MRRLNQEIERMNSSGEESGNNQPGEPKDIRRVLNEIQGATPSRLRRFTK